jgi:hypothetical protein
MANGMARSIAQRRNTTGKVDQSGEILVAAISLTLN